MPKIVGWIFSLEWWCFVNIFLQCQSSLPFCILTVKVHDLSHFIPEPFQHAELTSKFLLFCIRKGNFKNQLYFNFFASDGMLKAAQLTAGLAVILVAVVYYSRSPLFPANMTQGWMLLYCWCCLRINYVDGLSDHKIINPVLFYRIKSNWHSSSDLALKPRHERKWQNFTKYLGEVRL